MTLEQSEKSNALIETGNISISFWSLRDSLDAREWTPEYIKDLRNANPNPKFLSLVEKFDNARNAYILTLKNLKSEKAKFYKSLAYKAYANCYSEAGIEDKAEEMTKKYEEEKEAYILDL